MKLTHLFIDHPIFATVVSLFITIVGAVAYLTLPASQYPEIAPPTIQITANYPGASAEVVSETVATPLEQQINGVENMLYISSQATGDGRLTLTVTFKLGTNLDTAQVLTQNRVAIAQPRLPDAVQRLGVTVKKASPDIMMLISLSSPDSSRDQLYISNYATLQVKDVLARIDGVGDVNVVGARDFAMRVWLDPERVAACNLTAGDVVNALRAQNVQVSAGVLNQPPVPAPGAFQLNVLTLGRLASPSSSRTSSSSPTPPAGPPAYGMWPALLSKGLAQCRQRRVCPCRGKGKPPCRLTRHLDLAHGSGHAAFRSRA